MGIFKEGWWGTGASKDLANLVEEVIQIQGEYVWRKDKKYFVFISKYCLEIDCNKFDQFILILSVGIYNENITI